MKPQNSSIAPNGNLCWNGLRCICFASDNVSVTSVQLSYKVGNDWTTVNATRKSGNYLSGDFAVTIPGAVIAGTSLKYKWIINDYGNNTVNSDEYEVDVKAGITTGYFQNFDASYAPIGWYSMGANDSWEWGAPTFWTG